MKQMTQKRFSNHTTFAFEQETLLYTVQDKSGSRDFRVEYGDFPRSSNTLIEQNEWLRNVGLIWMGIGALEIGMGLVNGRMRVGQGFWLLVGTVCFALYKWTPTRYSVYNTEKGKVYIIRDKKHDEILAEINARKKQQLLGWYGEINRNNDPQKEIGKFKWLQDEGVLTEQEANVKIEQIKWSIRDV